MPPRDAGPPVAFSRRLKDAVLGRADEMPTDDELASSIAEKLADYRHGEIAALDAQHVELWGGQFPKGVRSTVLSEMNTVLSHNYRAENWL